MRRISSRVRDAVVSRRRRLDTAHRLIERRAPASRVAEYRQRLDEGRRILDRAMARLVPERRRRLTSAKRQLESLSPLNVLGRGYAIVEGADGRIRASAAALRDGEQARLRMRDGRARITVDGVERDA